MMPVHDGWREFVARRRDLIGGQIIHVEHLVAIYRGPITQIRIEDNYLIVETEWTAFAEVDSGGSRVGTWRKNTNHGAERFAYYLPNLGGYDQLGGPVTLTHPFCDVCLFPKGNPRLDRRDVQGL